MPTGTKTHLSPSGIAAFLKALQYPSIFRIMKPFIRRFLLFDDSSPLSAASFVLHVQEKIGGGTNRIEYSHKHITDPWADFARALLVPALNGRVGDTITSSSMPVGGFENAGRRQIDKLSYENVNFV